ncbi:thioredoxin [Persicitalea jodogahamensis]|uniref:Thioredoxin n=2 Tax=Persicitalea jodogahamensis TaxID=402147 RepID=A0A8J3G9I7_9BACT|nr:thioredoxin [Persicitalea jodogahamensis]
MAIFTGMCVLSCHADRKSLGQSGNHLGNASSPYLLEHADNPVGWYEWGDEALKKAKEENKPLIISIGYAACHWCHVMEEESFMDTAVANYMNAHFVSIKIDREERPDLDEIYMNAAQLINGNGGWPLNAFALPDGKPFYAGTYFSKDQWLKLLQNIHKAYEQDNATLTKQSEDLTQEIRKIQTAAADADTSAEGNGTLYELVYKGLLDQVDFADGGFKGAPKFPTPVRWEFLMQYAYLTKDKKALSATTTLLDKMARGGIYDQLGGGFARYATDDQWRVPHFEKMLYDNAQLVSLYAHAYQLTGNENYRRIIKETLSFVKRELTSAEGGFYSSINADSEGKEGKFYVWQYDEMARLLDAPELAALEKTFAISKKGNWEKGENILYLDQSAGLSDLSEPLVAKARGKLFAARAKRVHPSLDDKILVSWNALMLKGYVDAYRALGDPAYLQAAEENARFLEKYMLGRNFRLQRSFRRQKVSIDAFLEDYAFLADATLHLYQSNFNKHWFDVSEGLIEYADTYLFDAESNFYTTHTAKKENILINSIGVNDGVVPSANGIMSLTQYRLGKILYDEKYVTNARKMLDRIKFSLATDASSYTSWALLLGLEHYGTYEVAILGKNALGQNLLLQKYYLPNAVFAGGENENLPLLDDKKVAGQTRIYVCKDKVCKLPTDEVDQALKMVTF